MSKYKYVLAFDIYGTLLDTGSIYGALSERLQLDKGEAFEVSALWGRYQLEYTWRLNSMNLYEPFNVVTQKSLQHALKEFGISYNEDIIKELMESYNILPCFPATVPALQKLAENDSIKSIIFSNGTLPMVETALDAAGLLEFAPDIYVADAVQRYKPAPEIYKSLLHAVGKDAHPEQCILISGNPFDITGALAQGMRAIWVDRAKKGWTDSLLPLRDASEMKAMKTVNDLGEIPEFVASLG